MGYPGQLVVHFSHQGAQADVGGRSHGDDVIVSDLMESDRGASSGRAGNVEGIGDHHAAPSSGGEERRRVDRCARDGMTASWGFAGLASSPSRRMESR